MTENTSLAIIEKAQHMLEKATTIQEAKELKGMMLAAATWAKQMRLGEEAEAKARLYALRAEAKMGKMLKETERAKGGRPKKTPSKSEGVIESPPTLKEIGITEKEAFEARRVSEMADEKLVKIAEKKSPRKEVVEPHVSQNSGENEWYTPRKFIEAAISVMGKIAFDPASSKKANEVVGARYYKTMKDDGLKGKWGSPVWMNPPYAQPLCARFCEALIEKADSGEVSEACVLVNNATETAWFQGLLSIADAVCFPMGRVRFLDPGGNEGAPLQGQAIIFLSGNLGKIEKFVKVFSKFGRVLINE